MNQDDFYKQTLNRYANCFVEMTQQNHREKLASVFADDVRFKDPFNDVKGKDAVLSIFRHMYETLIEPRFEIHAALTQGSTGYIEWRFTFRIDKKRDEEVIQGMSRVTFNEAGLCCEHIDYWDSGEYVLRKIPILGWLNNWVARQLSVQ